jgi:hypothetical protein
MTKPRLRVLVMVLGVPALSLAALALGCAEPWQVLDTMCGHNALFSLALFCIVGWFVLWVISSLANFFKATP